MSKKLGINSKGGTNYLRHSKITTMLSNSKISPEERIKLAASIWAIQLIFKVNMSD
jgi:hypothetical protein